MSDLCCEFPDTTFKELMMGLNWLELYDIESVLAGRWNYDESVCRDKCQETKKNCLWSKHVYAQRNPHYLSWLCKLYHPRIRLDPHTKWFDHKSHSSGLKYEFAISVWQTQCVWINGPYPASLCHDKALFVEQSPWMIHQRLGTEMLCYFKYSMGKRLYCWYCLWRFAGD